MYVRFFVVFHSMYFALYIQYVRRRTKFGRIIIKNFANLSFGEKLKIKNMGSDRPNVIIINTNSKSSN